MRISSPTTRAGAYALLAAVAFGATTPLIARFGATSGPWTTAALLYAGATLIALPAIRGASSERRPGRRDLTRIALAAIVGAMLAPAALVWGIRHTGALSASLALAFEGVFTAAIAAIFKHEHLGTRALLGIVATALGGAALALGAPAGTIGILGLLAVVLATLLWAVDNTLTGSVADVDPGIVVAVKCALGAGASALVASAVHETLPASGTIAALVCVGAIGYGASLRWYLIAQRGFGVARTASVFATAPFVGAAIAAFIGEGRLGPAIAFSTMLLAIGVWLHLSEMHAHRHQHVPLVHEHAHSHDDGHHIHVHEPQVEGSHSHLHRHDALEHEHEHAPDLHHRHEHRHHRRLRGATG